MDENFSEIDSMDGNFSVSEVEEPSEVERVQEQLQYIQERQNFEEALYQQRSEVETLEQGISETSRSELETLENGISEIINKKGELIGYKVNPTLYMNKQKIAPMRKFTNGTNNPRKLMQARGYLKRTLKLKEPIKKKRFDLLDGSILRVTGGFKINETYFKDKTKNLRENYNDCINFIRQQENQISQEEYDIPRGTRSISVQTNFSNEKLI
jgi:hypothetical protein